MDSHPSMTIIIIMLIISVRSQNHLIISSYDGLVPCINDDDCSDFENGTCVDGICDCKKESFGVCESNKYNIVNEIGEKCEYTENCNMNHSECSENKKCECKKGFYASQDRKKCLKGDKKLKGNCEEDIQCFTGIASSICQNNTCVCPNNTHEVSGLCFRNMVLGQECHRDEECSLIKSSSCIDSRCECKKTHVATDFECLQIAYNIKDDCEKDIQCATTFGNGSQCAQGKCVCKEDYQFKEEYHKCVRDILLGTACGTDSDCFEKESDSGRLICVSEKCKCDSNYYRERDGECIEITSFGSNRTADSKNLAFTRMKPPLMLVLGTVLLNIICDIIVAF